MNVIAVTAETKEDGLKYLEAGADEVVFALEGHSFTALNAFECRDLSAFPRCSLLMNRFYFEEDLEELQKTLQALPLERIDSIYFSDPAVLLSADERIRKKLIYRPETLVVSDQDADWWMSQGIKAVSISPLLTKEEVERISHGKGREITIHGHLLMSESRRRLLSTYREYSFADKDFRNNKHLAIREEKREEHMPVYEDENGTLIYTDFIQQSFEVLPSFTASERFYIESVYSGTEEICDAIRYYRKILSGGDGKAALKEYQGKHPDAALSEGYYGQKTIR